MKIDLKVEAKAWNFSDLARGSFVVVKVLGGIHLPQETQRMLASLGTDNGFKVEFWHG